MTKRALFAVAGLLSLCLSLSAQQIDRPQDVFKALNNSALRTPALALSGAQFFSLSSGFNWMERTSPDFLPALSTPGATGPQRATANSSATMGVQDSSKEIVDVRRSNLFDYATGEVGFLYGRSSGKYGVTSEEGYIIGEVGNEHFHISAGASYENSTVHFPHSGR
jgi:hypothetical protein